MNFHVGEWVRLKWYDPYPFGCIQRVMTKEQYFVLFYVPQLDIIQTKVYFSTQLTPYVPTDTEVAAWARARMKG